MALMDFSASKAAKAASGVVGDLEAYLRSAVMWIPLRVIAP
jgi:hypothetical protein